MPTIVRLEISPFTYACVSIYVFFKGIAPVIPKELYAIDTQVSTKKERWRVKNDMRLAQSYFDD